MDTLRQSLAFETKSGGFIFNFQFSIFNSAQRRGISLMEVLASTFVIGVGLLGVLAVIPFGAYQVSKARDAEHCANMLDAASKDLAATGMAQMHTWRIPDTGYRLIHNASYDMDGNNAYAGRYFLNHTTQAQKNYACQRYLMVDPFDIVTTSISGNSCAVPHVQKVGNDFDNLHLWQERMRGQDDLEFTTHPNKRTDFSSTGGRIISSGKYTWFFMFRPQFDDSQDATVSSSYGTGAYYGDMVPVDVDLLACYNRTPGEGKTSYARYTPSNSSTNDYEPYEKGARITIRSTSASGLDLTNVKYVFVSWTIFQSGYNTLEYAEGVWCKIVNTGDIESDNATFSIPEINSPPSIATTHKRSIIVTGDLQSLSTIPNSGTPVIRVLAIPGVLYHKRIGNVQIR